MIFCRIDKCPIDGREICCIHCIKRDFCPDGCKKKSQDCNILIEKK